MNVKKFTASTAREALRKVREALGPDAVILSNRALENGVEILALANEDISSLAAPTVQDMPEPDLSHLNQAPVARRMAGGGVGIANSPPVASMAESLEMARRAQAQQANDMSQHGYGGNYAGHSYAPESDHHWQDDTVLLRSVERTPERQPERMQERMQERAQERIPERIQERMPERAPERGAERSRASLQERVASPRYDGASAMPERRSEVQPAQAAQARQNNQRAMPSEMMEMMQEIRAMRGMMETQLAELAWHSTQKREPQKAHVLRELLAAGFSPSLSRYLTEKLPVVKDEAEGMRWMRTVLERNIMTMKNENEVLEKGGVFALVGPTGVGKTTSTAKLAARCVMRHGTEKLALITTDGYRIGGHEQLRIYGKILGVMVHSVKDEADLRIALRELRGKHTVLIDTIGVSQRDQMVQEQVAMLSGAGADVQRLLCLNATSTGETLHEVVRAYQGNGLAGCIMTKLDEAATIGNVLDVVVRQKLNLFYLSNGQRVPEDLHLAERGYLIDRAFRTQRESSAFTYQDAELPLIMANSKTNDTSLREVHLG
ncbi:MAG: flagellar biosynthesis protein FlhF [Burkholderiales bacterium]|nr:flagellar biosynthesis protein FlhF [Burkholderiales bacterium]